MSRSLLSTLFPVICSRGPFLPRGTWDGTCRKAPVPAGHGALRYDMDGIAHKECMHHKGYPASMGLFWRTA